ncbi:hypothetical protein CBR_g18926 [Chara braunii]|uniref:CCHC-type domain-containing protein n=1 Tax=Chara braunii TaxID=69332 RepID=A0A388KWS2_CHABU|nr:hypothetical protein CBR_g18926 [Chara braunii]|eukprot:GBG74516.1 hypothetical protein CBR_g18926 [Chara braunii]
MKTVLDNQETHHEQAIKNLLMNIELLPDQFEYLLKTSNKERTADKKALAKDGKREMKFHWEYDEVREPRHGYVCDQVRYFRQQSMAVMRDSVVHLTATKNEVLEESLKSWKRGLQSFSLYRAIVAEVQADLQFPLTKPQEESTIEALFNLLLQLKKNYKRLAEMIFAQQSVTTDYKLCLQQAADLVQLSSIFAQNLLTSADERGDTAAEKADLRNLIVELLLLQKSYQKWASSLSGMRLQNIMHILPIVGGFGSSPATAVQYFGNAILSRRRSSRPIRSSQLVKEVVVALWSSQIHSATYQFTSEIRPSFSILANCSNSPIWLDRDHTVQLDPNLIHKFKLWSDILDNVGGMLFQHFFDQPGVEPAEHIWQDFLLARGAIERAFLQCPANVLQIMAIWTIHRWPLEETEGGFSNGNEWGNGDITTVVANKGDTYNGGVWKKRARPFPEHPGIASGKSWEKMNITQKVWQDRMDNHQCLKCGTEGHIIAWCPLIRNPKGSGQ